MSKESSIKNYTRGGQVTLHNIRMFIQITQKVCFASLMVFLVVTFSTAWFTTSEYERYVSTEYGWSTFIPLFNEAATTQFIQPNGVKVTAKYREINESTLVSQVVRNVSLKLVQAMLVGGIFSLGVMTVITIWLRRRGKSQTENKTIKGDVLASSIETKKIIIQSKMHSDLTLAGLPLIKDKETSHFLFHGSTGSGKTNAMSELLEQIRERGDRAIIYDKGGVYLEKFYQAGFDKLLNPLDTRGEEWDLWLECRDSADFDNLAAALIPMPASTQDPFWINGARTIFSTAAFQMRKESDRHHLKLLRYLLTADNEAIQDYLKGTYAETLVSEKIEKTAVSIKSVLATYLKSLKYITCHNNPFSIRQWIHDENAKNWLFITSLGDRSETLKPLISTYLDIAINTLLSLPPDYSRRIWIIIDEFQSLHQLPYIKPGLAEGRKHGACFAIGVQDYPGIADTYGKNGAESISTLLTTRLMFREPDANVAKWSAQNLGETIVEEVREGISYGANTTRDGVTVNRYETTKPLVNYSEIMTLDDLHAYIRLPGKYPITLLNFIYKQRAKVNEGYILRAIDESHLEEVNVLLDKFEKPALTSHSLAITSNKKNKRNEKINNQSSEEYALDV
ncbi:MAG: type IV conjugative transfer system coupling protein TraD [Gammaproteobacteria bacterium]